MQTVTSWRLGWLRVPGSCDGKTHCSYSNPWRHTVMKNSPLSVHDGRLLQTGDLTRTVARRRRWMPLFYHSGWPCLIMEAAAEYACDALNKDAEVAGTSEVMLHAVVVTIKRSMSMMMKMPPTHAELRVPVSNYPQRHYRRVLRSCSPSASTSCPLAKRARRAVDRSSLLGNVNGELLNLGHV